MTGLTFEPGSLGLGSSALTTRPTRLLAPEHGHEPSP
jgi:hypothetical protein